MPKKMYYIVSNKYNLQERITKLNGKVYDVYFRVVDQSTGKEKQKKLSGYKTKTFAKNAYLEFVENYCEYVKGNPVRKKKSGKQIVTFKQVAEEYLCHSVKTDLKASTIYCKRKMIEAHFYPFFDNKPIDSISKDDIEKWQECIKNTVNKKNGKFYSYKTLSGFRTHLFAIFAYANKHYGTNIEYRDVQQIPKKRYDVKKSSIMDIWRKEDFEQFISSVDDPMWNCFFTLLFYTGRRKGEIFALTKSDIHGDKIWFNKSISRKTLDGNTFNVTETKAYKSQEIPVCKQVQDALNSYPGDEPFFFGGEKPLADNTTRRRFREYCEKSKVRPIRIHDLRHSFVSMLIHKGAQIMLVADLIGDEPEQITKTYGHLYAEDKISLLSKL